MMDRIHRLDVGGGSHVRRDSEMMEADDWADTFVDSSSKFDPNTYNKRELAHRLDEIKSRP